MKILVDGRSLLPIGPGLGPTGVGRWTKNVVRALGVCAPSWEIVLTVVTREDISIDISSFSSNTSLRVVRIPERWFRRALVLGIAPRIDRFLGRADVMLGPTFVTWPGRFAEIPVIHDLAFVTHPDSVQRRNLAFLRLLVPRSLRRAAGIVTVSEAIRDEIAERFAVDRRRIFVVPNAPTLSSTSDAGIEPGYLLFVGTFEPRKNLAKLLEAYRLLRARHDDIPRLVVVGGPGWRGAEELQRMAAETPDVVPLGYVDDDRLAALYRDASMLVFPSLYEGFGLPVLEAMAARTPVVTSERGAIPEVAGDAAFYVDPLSATDIAAGIARVLQDPAMRDGLVSRGVRRAAEFTWERSGRALKNAIEAATKQRS